MQSAAPSYRVASKRHSRDAVLLENNQRLANADQLWALAAECALKSILRAAGLLTLDPNGRPLGDYAVHINKLWPLLSGIADRKVQSLVARLTSKAGPSPFGAWSIDQRYQAREPEVATLAAHRLAALACVTMLDEARANGMLEPAGGTSE